MGRNQAKGDRYAMIPLGVLEHPASATLSLSAFKVLVVLASQYSGGNNGTMACTESWARKFGITGTDTVRVALKELVSRDLIEVTRPGMKMKTAPTLFALTWKPVNNRNGQPIAQPHPASHRYTQWNGAKWDKKKQRWEKTSHPSSGGSVTPSTGVDEPCFTPNGGAEQPFSTPLAGDTLRISPEVAGSGPPPDPVPIRNPPSKSPSKASGRFSKLRRAAQ